MKIKQLSKDMKDLANLLLAPICVSFAIAWALIGCTSLGTLAASTPHPTVTAAPAGTSQRFMAKITMGILERETDSIYVIYAEFVSLDYLTLDAIGRPITTVSPLACYIKSSDDYCETEGIQEKLRDDLILEIRTVCLLAAPSGTGFIDFISC